MARAQSALALSSRQCVPIVNPGRKTSARSVQECDRNHNSKDEV